MGFKVLGLIAMVHAVILLTVSFFVLFAVRKIEKEQGLRVFGYVIATLLWIAALAVFSAGVYKISKGQRCMGKGMIRQHMQGMMQQEQGSPMMKK